MRIDHGRVTRVATPATAGLLLVGVTVALAACGSEPAARSGDQTSAAASPSPSLPPTSAAATAPSSTTYLAVEVGGSSAPAVHIVDMAGKLVAAASLSGGTGVSVVGVGSHGAYIAGPGHQLGRLELDGRVHALDPTPTSDAGELAGLAESPDGTQWAYSLVSFANDANMTATTRVYVASMGASTRMVAQLQRPEFNSAGGAERYGGGYAVLRWDTAGLLLGSHPTGVGGVGPFIGEGYGLDNVVRLDPRSGQTSNRIGPTGCRFGDVASDGAVACLASGGITVSRAGGSASTVPVPGQQSDHPAGGIAFIGGSSTLIYSVATFSTAFQQAWTDTLMVATDSGGHLSSTTVAASLSSRNEGHAWSHVVDGNTVAVIVGPADSSSVALLTTTSGKMVTLGAADSIDGVIHATS